MGSWPLPAAVLLYAACSAGSSLPDAALPALTQAEDIEGRGSHQPRVGFPLTFIAEPLTLQNEFI